MRVTNTTARHIALHCSGLSPVPTGPCTSVNLLQLIKALGYVQQDPLNIVARAHDHILWSRNNQYRPRMLDRLLSQERSVFEHFSHDACVLPMDTLPYWTEQFRRRAKKISATGWGKHLLGRKDRAAMIERIRNEGPLRSNDFKSPESDKPKIAWAKPAHKQTLDYLWLNGELAVSKRVKFSKYYDLSERVYPEHWAKRAVSVQERIHWLCSNALTRLGYGAAGDIMRFWEACNLEETKQWCEQNAKHLNNVSVDGADGQSLDLLSHRSQASLLKKPPKPTTRLRVISPFDPIVRDRKRLARVFGFDYRIEIYTPAAKRQYGYYVYPLLEFDAFVGRIEIRHDRQTNQLCVDNLWSEDGIAFGKGRMAKLESELERLRRFCAADTVSWSL